MKIVCDTYIPFLAEAVRHEWPHVEILPMKPEEINSSSVHDADVLVVRTRTKVNKALLEGSKVQMICTATIGFDHIDAAYCDAMGISWMSCPGCNAQAVCDYIEEAINSMYNVQLTMYNSPPTIGIVGVGHVGSLVAKMAERKGLKVLLNDPPKEIGVSLDEIAKKCDIITFHVPLDKTTYHLCDAAFLAKCQPGAIIINAARGGVVDEAALLRSGHPYILDTWENEPAIDREVTSRALLASMHIAGYSVEGKRKASQMCLNAISEKFGLPKVDLSAYEYHGLKASDTKETQWLKAITDKLKSHPEQFEQLRKNYPLR